MKTSFVLIALAIGLPTLACADSAIPGSMERERYDGTRKISPFALATKLAPIVEAPPEVSFAKDMFLTAYSKVAGIPYVAIRRMGDQETIRLFGNEPDADGIQLVDVNEQEGRKTTVTLKKGGQTATVRMDESREGSAVEMPGVREPLPKVVPVKTKLVRETPAVIPSSGAPGSASRIRIRN